MHVRRILRRPNPSDLPVEQPNKSDLVVDLGTAKAPGLTLPTTLLQRADDVIR
ncbi:MAG: hypothetical protein U1F58_03520 [Burkholderiales bacterium]